MRLNAAIRKAAMQKIPYIIIIGEKEEQSNTITVRTRDGKDLGAMTIEQFINFAHKQIESKE